MAIEIRDAAPDDEKSWRQLWTEHFDFHKVELAPAVTDHTWRRILDPASTMSMRVAIVDGEMLGYALYFAHPSSWVIADYCYLEDLYVGERARGRGLGRALMDDLIALAKSRGWSQVYWHTHAGNEGARKLYDQYVEADGSVRYRLPLDGS